MWESILLGIQYFKAWHINAFYSVIYFIQKDMLYLIMLIAAGYLLREELKYNSQKFIHDERNIV